MRTRVTGFFIKSILVLLFAFAAFYLMAVLSYRSGFSYGTRINGVNCAGMSIPEVSTVLLDDYPVSDVTVSFPDDTEGILKADDIGISVNYEPELYQIRYTQNPILWGLDIFRGRREVTVTPAVSFDRDKLKKAIGELEFVKEHDPDRNMYLSVAFIDGIYTLADTTGSSVNEDYVFDYIYNALCKGDTQIRIPETFLTDHEYSDSELRVLDLWHEIEDFIRPGLVYDMGDEKIPIDERFLCSCLVKENGMPVKDEDGRFKVDEAMVIAFADDICNRYDTFEKPLTFVDCNGEQKTVERNYYGTLIDREAEVQYLLNAVKNGIKEEHVPKYIHEPYHRGLDDIGPDRIEIDLTRQKLYYFRDGKLDIESDVVTGNPRTLHATNEMITTVRKKQQDTYLSGEGYRSFVHYWIAVYKNTIGIHDASWQQEFGGDRYLTHGSKGCINAPDDVAADLYSKVEVGMPVLIYK